ncbi:MAG: hypothetical protein ISS34_02935 [Candidatus Omnitrophica bacterium]|nr:hypothetical protein [Candidatus Omnitrophota bacterium]
MIARMKKITVIVSNRSRDGLLLKLREAGAVHIKHVTEPFSDETNRLEERMSLLTEAVDILNTYKRPPHKDTKTQKPEEELIKTAQEIIERQSEKEASLISMRDIKTSIAWFRPWGDFDPKELEVLEERGVFVKLYRLRKNEFKKIPSALKEKIHIIKRERPYLYFAFISKERDESLNFTQIPRPKKSLWEFKKGLGFFKRQIEKVDTFIKASIHLKSALKDEISILERRLKFINVRDGMKDEASFSYLQGYCPQEDVPRISSITESEGAGYLAEDPDDPNETPTFIKNPRWIDIISPVFKFMNTLPGYREYDISLPFLIFFSLFFAMLIGDAGYGLVFLVITLLARLKARNAPREPFFLMYLLSLTTIAWGAITGTYFGSEGIARLPFLNGVVIDSINSFAADNQNFMIYICFVIGAVHLSIAHLMQAARTINSLKCMAQLGWISVVWGIFFAAGTLVIARPFPVYGGYLLGAGVGLILFFSNFQKNIIKGIFTTLADLPLKIISSFSDVVSYLRLFAVGYASVIMARSFNEMAMGAGFGTIASSLGAALILFLGHTLNIVLGLMAVIVHGIRLNMLEFSGHMNMQWSGREYKPFK